jgi:hypothetical protein
MKGLTQLRSALKGHSFLKNGMSFTLAMTLILCQQCALITHPCFSGQIIGSGSTKGFNSGPIGQNSSASRRWSVEPGTVP